MLVFYLAFILRSLALVELDISNFESYVSSNQVLVTFYAPWCIHCKHLLPELEQAEKLLLSQELTGLLAKVDATQEAELAQKYEISGFPTILWFSKGTIKQYEGSRYSNSIVDFVLKGIRNAAQWIPSKELLDKELQRSQVAVVLNSFDESKILEFSSQAELYKDACDFFMVQNIEIPELSIQRYDQTYESIETIDLSIYHKCLKDFGEINPQNYNFYFESGLPIFWFFVESNSQLEQYNQELTNLANQFRGQIKFVYLQGTEYQSHMQSLGITEMPGIAISHDKLKYLYTGALQISEIKQFVEDFNQGKLQQFIQSEEVSVRVKGRPYKVVAQNLVDVILSGQNVLILFYNEYCEFCIDAVKVFEDLAKQVKSDNILIGYFDTEANDMPIDWVDIKHQPSIYLFPSSDPFSFQYYEDEIDVEALKAFLRIDDVDDISALIKKIQEKVKALQKENDYLKKQLKDCLRTEERLFSN